MCVCKLGFNGTACEVAPDNCDVGKCEFCAPHNCAKDDWCTAASCNGHGVCDPSDKRMCTCSADYTGTWCDVAPKPGCTSKSAPNFNAEATTDDGSCRGYKKPAPPAPSAAAVVGGAEGENGTPQEPEPDTRVHPGGLLRVGWIELPANIGAYVNRKGGALAGECGRAQPLAVATHQTEGGTAYIAWTEDTAWGTSSEQGAVHVSKINLNPHTFGGKKPLADKRLPGFVMNAEITVSPSGGVGVLVGKLVKGWMDQAAFFKKGAQCPARPQRKDEGGSCLAFDKYDGAAWNFGYAKNPLALVVAKLDSVSLEPEGTPFLIGPAYVKIGADGNTSSDDTGVYPLDAQRCAGVGQLIYGADKKRWTAVYGGTWVDHTASCFRSVDDDASKDQDGETPPTRGSMAVPGVKIRPGSDNSKGWNFCGGHESRVVSRYHPGTKTIGTMCQNEKSEYHFKIDAGGNRQVVAPKESYAGGVRPCVDATDGSNHWIVAYGSKDSKATCNRYTDLGKPDGGKNDPINDARYNQVTVGTPVVLSGDDAIDKRSVKIATLGGSERTGSCSRFLVGWATSDKRRMLAEVDGKCNMLPGFPIDATNYTTWDSMVEWSTTETGDVVWAGAWDANSDLQPKGGGETHQPGCAYGTKPRKGRADWAGALGYDGYAKTQGFVSNIAHVSIYLSTHPGGAPASFGGSFGFGAIVGGSFAGALVFLCWFGGKKRVATKYDKMMSGKSGQFRHGASVGLVVFAVAVGLTFILVGSLVMDAAGWWTGLLVSAIFVSAAIFGTVVLRRVLAEKKKKNSHNTTTNNNTNNAKARGGDDTNASWDGAEMAPKTKRKITATKKSPEKSSKSSTRNGRNMMPKPWEALFSEEGKPYFHNTETGETSWSLPASNARNPSHAMMMHSKSSFESVNPMSLTQQLRNSVKDSERELLSELKAAPLDSSTVNISGSSPDANKAPLPHGWEEHLDEESGRSYYYHERTDETTWDRPGSAENSSRQLSKQVERGESSC